MNIAEAAKEALASGRAITRKDKNWRKDRIRIRPKDTWGPCFARKLTGRGRVWLWKPTAGDLAADDWEAADWEDADFDD